MPRHLLLASVSVLLLSAVIFGAAQMAEVNKLRASLAGLTKERDALRKQIWARPKPAEELPARPEHPDTAAADETKLAADESTAPGSPGQTRGRRAGPGGFANVMNSPEVQQLMAIQQKSGLDGRYAALFKKLNLSPAELENFKNLLVDKQSTVMDVMSAARSQGMSGRENRDEIRQLVTDTQAEIDGNIRTALGDAAYAEYKNFETTLPQRGVVDQLAQRLSYSSTPLNETQTDQLVKILAANTPAATGNNRTSSFAQTATAGSPRPSQTGTLFNGSTAPITDTVIAQARGVLTPSQVAALQSLQQEQQAAAQLMQQMRSQSRGGQQRIPSTPTGGSKN